MYEYFEAILKEQKKRAKDVSEGTGISSSTLSEWKTQKRVMSGDKLVLIAQYLNVSLDRLMTGKEFVPVRKELSSVESDILQGFWNASDEIQQMICTGCKVDYQKVALEKKERISA